MSLAINELFLYKNLDIIRLDQKINRVCQLAIQPEWIFIWDVNCTVCGPKCTQSIYMRESTKIITKQIVLNNCKPQLAFQFHQLQTTFYHCSIKHIFLCRIQTVKLKKNSWLNIKCILTKFSTRFFPVCMIV